MHITVEESSVTKFQSSVFKPKVSTLDLQVQIHISLYTINCPTNLLVVTEKI